MFNKDFFPTPISIISKMVAPYRDIRTKYILEPSAGKGNIVNYLVEIRSVQKRRIDCVELEADLIAILQSKDYRVVSFDFEKYFPKKSYDLILMNPPFSAGVKHLLHAWRILDDGDICCILPTESLKNPYTAERKQLCEIIKKHGIVEHLGSAFASAERKTGVDVSIIRLKKKAKKKSEFFETNSFSRNKTVEFTAGEQDFLPANKDLVKNLVDDFNRAIEGFKQLLAVGADFSTMFNRCSGISLSNPHLSESGDYVYKNLFTSNHKAALNVFIEELTKDSWRNLINRCDLKGLMTRNVRKAFEDSETKYGPMEFTEENVYSLLLGLHQDITKIIRESTNEAFDLLTKHHKDNREYVEGWKTNDRFKVKRKFILPHIVEVWSDRYDTDSYYSDAIEDLERVLCALSGKKYHKIRSISQIIREDDLPARSRLQVETEFFIITLFKKGSGHFYFRDQLLWERFCIEAAKGKNWLPSEYTYGECMQMLKAA